MKALWRNGQRVGLLVLKKDVIQRLWVRVPPESLLHGSFKHTCKASCRPFFIKNHTYLATQPSIGCFLLVNVVFLSTIVLCATRDGTEDSIKESKSHSEHAWRDDSSLMEASELKQHFV